MTATFRLSPHLDFVAIVGAQTSSGYDYYYAGTTLRGVSESQGGVARRTESHTGGWTNEDYFSYKIGRAHVRTQVTNAQLVCRLLIEKKKKKSKIARQFTTID